MTFNGSEIKAMLTQKKNKVMKLLIDALCLNYFSMIFILFSFCFSGIRFNNETNVFSLDTDKSSYQFLIGPSNYLIHLYYGSKVLDDVDHLNVYFTQDFDPSPYELAKKISSFSLNELLQEYPTYGDGDFRVTCLAGYNSEGVMSLVLKYKSHRILRNTTKPEIPGLPHSKSDNVDILDIEMFDDLFNCTVHLFYSVFYERDVITRWATIKNDSNETLTLIRAMSACLDFRDSDYDLTSFDGAPCRERQLNKSPLRSGKITIDSIRGASSHQHNPFTMISSKNADEKSGIVYGISLVYSGNFAVEAEVDQSDQTRITIGINPNQFRYIIQPEETFYTPEAVMVFSDNGYGEMSRKMHRFVKENIMQSKWKNKKRPVLINSWEAMYFDFDDKKLINLAIEASKLGIELFVLDDGWFGHRNFDNSSLGDWYVNLNKITCGMPELVRQINDIGMSFGLWFEPEMISEDSDLYRAHTEYAMKIQNRNPFLTRNQLVLDFTNSDVVDNIYNQMADILSNSNISYIKWDMNRHITDLYSLKLPPERKGEIFHRYILGVYDLLNRISSTFPNILIEGCSGGGGRFDLGMLYYSPQFWGSDDTDPIERLKIQFGTSFAYPISAIGSHVSVSPNEQTGRETPFNTRGVVAMSGTFGYELDVTKLNESDKEEIKAQIQNYHKFYDLINYGDFYRLASPYDSLYYCAWMFVNANKSHALLNIVKKLIRPNEPPSTIKLDGLDPNKQYIIHGLLENAPHSGGCLMNAGIFIPEVSGDFNAFQYEITAV